MRWCDWFALCDRPADFTAAVPGLGQVQVCQRCAKAVGIPPESLTPLPLVSRPAAATSDAGATPS